MHFKIEMKCCVVFIQIQIQQRRKMDIRSLFSVRHRQVCEEHYNLYAKPKDLYTPQNSTSNLTKHQERCHTNIKLVTLRKQPEDESGEKTKQQKHSPILGCLNLEKWGDWWQSILSKISCHFQQWIRHLFEKLWARSPSKLAMTK